MGLSPLVRSAKSFTILRLTYYIIKKWQTDIHYKFCLQVHFQLLGGPHECAWMCMDHHLTFMNLWDWALCFAPLCSSSIHTNTPGVVDYDKHVMTFFKDMPVHSFFILVNGLSIMDYTIYCHYSVFILNWSVWGLNFSGILGSDSEIIWISVLVV